MILLVAIEPASYRETIGYVIQSLRPALRVEVVSPDEPGSRVKLLGADLVLSSQPRPEPASKPGWIEFRPYDEPMKVRANGRDVDFERPVELDDLLAVIDETGRA